MITAQIFWQSFINGILMGGIYALVAVGLTLIYGVMNIMNFAHGEFLMLGMYISYWAFTLLGIDPYLSVVIAFLILFLIGTLIEKTMIEPVLKGQPLNQLLLTIGISLFLSNMAVFLWSSDNRSLQTTYSNTSFNLGNIVLHEPRLVAFLFAVVISIVLYIFLQKTKIGKGIRAASQHKEGALLVGIDVKKSYMIAFGIGVACAGIAGVLLSPFFYINPTVGAAFSFTAYVIVVLGTMGNFVGALIGGLIIGIAEAIGGIVFMPSLKQVISFGIFILVLLFKPTGLFGGQQ
ncbi:branched-chain amino acid ABC transporter permease [Moorella sulfitireducens]|uniref:branched-chain amino acid ABC transporter permease n=1 Tax=Neomoorella sulfitireducens TaxID=2972948 RepID=UPI0021ABC82A